MIIKSDAEFKATLSGLTSIQQHQVAARFAENVLPLCNDHRLKGAIDSAKQPDFTRDDLDAAYRSTNAVSVDSYTQCGHDCDWNSQASHFVAQAVLDGLKPAMPGSNPAWNAAMHARMARSCESVAAGRGTDNVEAAAQYRILTEFMNS